MTELYPLKFHPIFKEKLWGGSKLKSILNKESPFPNTCGESWEISTVEGNVSKVNGGSLDGKYLDQLINEYKSDLVGKHVYDRYGNDFPLLIKFIDANQDLSVQVHPDDEFAERLGVNAKTEMWYVFEADKGATLISGFNKELNPEEFRKKVHAGEIMKDLNQDSVRPGDFFFIPGRRIHTIGKGILLAEIQQSSDTTYRVYDFDRVDPYGNKRELHLEESIKVMDFDQVGSNKAPAPENGLLVESPYFVTSLWNDSQEFDFSERDSFSILIVTEGLGTLTWENQELVVNAGDSLLIPSVIKQIKFQASGTCRYLECYHP